MSVCERDLCAESTLGRRKAPPVCNGVQRGTTLKGGYVGEGDFRCHNKRVFELAASSGDRTYMSRSSASIPGLLGQLPGIEADHDRRHGRRRGNGGYAGELFPGAKLPAERAGADTVHCGPIDQTTTVTHAF